MVNQRGQPQTNGRNNNRHGAGGDGQDMIGCQPQANKSRRFVNGAAKIDRRGRRHPDGVHHGARLTRRQQYGPHTCIQPAANRRDDVIHRQHHKQRREDWDQKGAFKGQQILRYVNTAIQPFDQIACGYGDNQRANKRGGHGFGGKPGQFFRIKVQHQRRLRGDKATDKPGREGQLSADRVGDKGGKHRDGEAEQQPAERFGQIAKFQYREIETGEFA